MNYFDDESNVMAYIEMAEGYDGRDLVEKLGGYLEDGSTVLELGMGPGTDLDLLRRTYQATGSDSSDVFLSLYRRDHPDVHLEKLNAVTIETGLEFQGIYSNKVLHHLTRGELQRSLRRQAEVLQSGGIALHTFWRGEGEELHEGLRSVYYEPDELREVIPDEFKILELSLYQEMEEDDSICLVLERGD